MTLKNAIKRLMSNDRDGSWDEIDTIEELKESLECSIDEHKNEPEVAEFYANILKEL